MDREDRRADHDAFAIDVRAQPIENTPENTILHPAPEALEHCVPFAELEGSSRHGAPFRPVHATASINRRTSSSVWLEPFLPMQCGLMASHWWSFASIPVMAARLVVFWVCSLESELCGKGNPRETSRLIVNVNRPW